MIKKLLIFFSGLAVSVLCGVFIVTSMAQSPLLSPVVTTPETVLGFDSTPAPTYRPLTIDNIFSTERYTPSVTDITMMATGDIIPARVTDSQIRKRGAAFPFEKIAETLQTGDFVMANLEAPLTSGCTVRLEGMVFCGIPAFAKAMRDSNISVVTLENNHILNQGTKGKEETLTHLNNAGIATVIARSPILKEIKNTTFGFVAINGVGPAVNRDAVQKEIEAADEIADVVVVSIHWGKEYVYDPARAAGIAVDDPQEIGHFLIDAGADVVIGNHPHWVQGVEIYNDGFISYAHGNFIFDQEWSRETKEGVIGSYIFSNKKLVDVSFTPVIIEDYAQPRLATIVEGAKILNAMKRSSIGLLTN